MSGATEPGCVERQPLERMAAQLEASGAYRILRLEPRGTYHAPDGISTRRGVFLDVETTGLDPATDEIVELAMAPFDFARDGRIFAVHEPFSRFRDPERPIPAAVTALTGITDAMVAGASIDAAEIEEFLGPARARILEDVVPVEPDQKPPLPDTRYRLHCRGLSAEGFYSGPKIFFVQPGADYALGVRRGMTEHNKARRQGIEKFLKPVPGEHSDLAASSRLLAAMTLSYGLSNDGLLYRADSDDALFELRHDPAARRRISDMLGKLQDRALRIARDNRSQITDIADALLRRRFLPEQDIAAILAHPKVRPIRDPKPDRPRQP